MLNIVIPMAGAGSRFAKEGFVDPKPLIQIDGLPMIQVVVNNLRPNCDHRFIFICQEQHIESYNLREKLSGYASNSIVIGIDGLTEGAACTVLKAKDLINNENPLMIANSDQYVDIDINDYLATMDEQDLDGLIMTMTANDPKWSYVGLSTENLVGKVVEKQVISSEATVGIYNFKKGSDFVDAAEDMIKKNMRSNNEFYVAPAYNQIIEQGGKIGIYNIGSEGMGMYGLGIPADLRYFLSKPEMVQKAKKGLL